jgi:hypothetical protein
MKGDSFVVQWCVQMDWWMGPCHVQWKCVILKGILRPYPEIMNLSIRTGKATGYTLRCNTNRNHEVASRKFSFFESSKLTIQDVMVFVKSYLTEILCINVVSFLASIAKNSWLGKFC